jgi:probable H4MPT-linked C1 transfer pathway protein
MHPHHGFVGWDLGGAHLKVALVDDNGHLRLARQVACPLWEGMQRLESALDAVLPSLPPGPLAHGLTMTGELADIFENRDQGVERLTACMARRLPGVQVFAGRAGWLDPGQMNQHHHDIASANWYATASFLAQKLERGILLDIGSTTTDIIPFGGGAVLARGYSDAERLASEELVYTGVVRTPVMAVARRAPFAGEWQHLAAERFATMGDVYRLTGALTDNMLADWLAFDTADGAGADPLACARRLARMLGRDGEEASLEAWAGVARFIARSQMTLIRLALERVLSRAGVAGGPVVGAGAGRFLARSLAAQLGLPYADFAELLEGAPSTKQYGAVCAPAAAVAHLLRSSHAATPPRRDPLPPR